MKILLNTSSRRVLRESATIVALSCLVFFGAAAVFDLTRGPWRVVYGVAAVLILLSGLYLAIDWISSKRPSLRRGDDR